jgi:hypothetical protein
MGAMRTKEVVAELERRRGSSTDAGDEKS